MSLNAFLKIKGEIQGSIDDSVIQKGREKTIMIFEAEHEVNQPIDTVSGNTTGKRIHKPFTIVSGALNSKCDDTGKINEYRSMNTDTIIKSEITESGCDTLDLTYKDIQPVLEKNCYKCHSGNAPSELFNLETYSQVKEMGDAGKLSVAINHLPGYKSMPRKAPKLPGCDLTKLNAWITNGMKE
ncbi:MAG TPA: type VI secretion system tube protein Hcp [Ignavibacteria bacterium]|nr:type VI secretion system tube protein Hcp [Ignavibacteria bacterium]